METGQVLQIVLTVVIIIGAGAVALICDLLKTNNERLRDANTELRVRREEERRRGDMALEQLAQLTLVAANRALPPPSTAALEEGPPANGRRREPRRIEPPEFEQSAAEFPDRKPGETLAEARALARNLLATRTGSAGRGDAAVEDPPAPSPKRKNWDMLLKSAGSRRHNGPTIDITPAFGRQRGELIPFESLPGAQDALHLPAGYHAQGPIVRLLDNGAPLRGFVLAVSVNQIEEVRARDGELAAASLVDAVVDHLRGLLEPGDFACQCTLDRYVIVATQRDGANQRRMQEFREKLCEFQPESPATAPGLIQCGASEATGESLREAVSAALEAVQRQSRTEIAPAAESSRRRRAV